MKYIIITLHLLVMVACNGEKKSDSGVKINEMEMFKDMMDNHYYKIFPKGQRNSGGPMFFKYIYENLANNHDEFVAYNKFYCGVSGSIIMPNRPKRYTTVKLRDKNNKCVVGNYYRCCWPCSGDIMKYARVDNIEIKLPNDKKSDSKNYNVLTINDPCQSCVNKDCTNFPREVGAFKCENGLTKNGLRIKNDKITHGQGRLIFALFHPKEKDDKFDPDFPKQCKMRHQASLVELDKMGGMGNIFVKLALLSGKESYEICEK